jgi:hypothetical protein
MMSRIVVMKTEQGEDLFLRGNPSEDEVRQFILIQNNRYKSNHPAGPSGIDAYKITEAFFLNNEMERFNLEAEKTPIDISNMVD